jgi:hypothetical protein
MPSPPLGFWETLLRPIPSNTPVTPTIAIIKLVTPLSFILAAVSKSPEVGLLLVYVGIAPVSVALMQIVYLTLRYPDKLMSEPHIQEMARINRAQITQNNPDGSNSKVAGLSDRMGDNPGMNTGTSIIHGSETGDIAE